MVTISDAKAVEGLDKYLVFNLSLFEALPLDESLTLELAAENNTAQGGLKSEFQKSLGNDPIDYDNKDFEVSLDNGKTWSPATDGNAVTFAFGQQNLLVRLAINDDRTAEGFKAETMTLKINDILSGNPPALFDLNDTGTGFIEDDDNRGNPINIVISDPTVTEGEDEYIEWDVGLSSASDKQIVLKLETVGRTAKGGSRSDFGKGGNNPVDFSDRDFEFSGDGGKTWRSIPNGNAAIPVGFSTGQTKVRTRLNDDDVAENTESLELRVVSVSANNQRTDKNTTEETTLVNDSSDVGVATIQDNDTQPYTLKYEAEEATLAGPVIRTGKGSQGSGYVDYQNSTGDYIEWEVDVPAAGTVDLNWRYANGSPKDRPLELIVNGVTESSSASFPPTGAWNTWGLATQSVPLNEGTNTIRLEAIGSSGANFDWLEVSGAVDVGDNGIPISTLPFTQVRIEGSRVFTFDGLDGGMTDKDGQDIGFTMADPTSNPSNPSPPLASVVGYWPEKLDVTNGVLKLTTTSGIQFDANNNQDNALGVGLNVPSRAINLDTTLVNLPTAAGGYAQAGLWFGQALEGGVGSSEDNYIKAVIVSPQPGDYRLQALMEQNGITVQTTAVDIPNTLNSLSLNLFIDPDSKTVTARYGIDNDESLQSLGTFTNVPDEWFSFDQAGINPEVATRSFGGIFATHRVLGSSQVYSFDDFSVTEADLGIPDGEFPFDRWSVQLPPGSRPTAMDYGPDGRLYVATVTGEIYALDVDPDTRTSTTELIDTISATEGFRLTLGLAVDPDSTPNNVILWVAHSDGSFNNGTANTGKISRLSGSGFSQKEDVITELPRAIANHSTNNIDFGPDGRLYIWQGGNTGAGAANTEPTEFGDRPEQVLSAAVLVADVKDPNFKGTTGSIVGTTGTDANGNPVAIPGEFVEEFYARTGSDVLIYASGLRNTYDGIFHSNGNLYAPDNGLGVTGTVPPVPRLGDPSDRSITTQFGDVNLDNPGAQPDLLNRIVEGGFYGYPNPYLDEVVFKDGSFQGFNSTNTPANHPEYSEPFLNLGDNKSANGITEYTADNFFGELQGSLLINNFSKGDDITQVELSANGLSTTKVGSLTSGFIDPLPIEMGLNGSIAVGEFNGERVTFLEPLGTWREDLPSVPAPILDPGSTVLDGKLYLIGGKNASSHVNTVSVYDPGDPFDASDDVWTTAPDLPGPAVENPSVVSYDGQIYVFGGSTAPFSGAVNNAAVFDPVTSSWSSLTDMPTARGGATVQVIGDDIYVIGGLGDDGTSLNTVEIFDPLTGSWTSGTDLQTPRDNPGSAVINDNLYVFGGRTRTIDELNNIESDTLNSIEIYDPQSNSWTYGAPMPTGRRTMGVGTLNNRIQVIGGEGNVGGNSFFQNEEYNPVTDTWRTLPSIPTGRHGAGFGTIDDVVYVAGGGPTTGSSFSTVNEAFTL